MALQTDTAAMVLIAVLGLVGLVRIVEILLSRRNEVRLLARGGRRAQRDGLPWIVASQLVLFGGAFAEGLLLEPPTRITILAWLFLPFAFAALGVRHWCIRTLGDHWTFRVITVPDQHLVTRGPYRYLRHPNYVAVVVEFVSLCAAFQLWYTLAAVSSIAVPALAYRVHREEQALRPLRTRSTVQRQGS